MHASSVRPRLGSVVGYAVVLVAMMFEKAGQTTADTKASLVDAPGELLRSTFSLWNPQVSLGELQNQAYGYLFPMGPFFAGLDSANVPAWVTERLWSWVVIVVACEGARLVCREFGISAWPAVAAGLAYGLNVRMVSEIGVRSAEVLPTAVLPWVLLPVIWVFRGRVDPRLGAMCSGALFLFSGAVNGTATVAPLPLVAIFVVWGCRRGLVRWSFCWWWSAMVALASVWWASSLLQLSAYSPPFFDYVEDARTTTSTSGFEPSLRGASNWVGYLATGGEPSWPAAWSLNYAPGLIAVTGILAAVSVIGLATFRSPWRIPLVLSALLGLVCLTVGHTSSAWLQSPLGPTVQSLLDHPFALLRNIAKVDPVLRLPLAVGFGAALARVFVLARVLRERRARRRVGAVRAAVVAACLLVVAGAQPVWALNLRTPGWSEVPSYWTQTARFLEQQQGQSRAWVVPGTGFGIQTWGWTMDEPMSIIARTPWVTRSQVPLVNAETIRMLSSLEDVLDTGSGSARLGAMLDRIGLGFVVLRHDLDRDLADTSPPSVVSIALARSSGIERVATFGNLDFGPAIEVFEVTGRDRSAQSDLRVRSAATARTVAVGTADLITAAGAGLLEQDEAAVVAGDSGWSRRPGIVGDGYQLRERQFGRVHASEGAVLAPGEPHQAIRRVENYPGNAGSRPVVAKYHGIRYVDASTSQGYPDSFGPIRSETAPFAAVDGDPKTGWTTGYLTRPKGQWLAVHYERRRIFDTVRIQGDVESGGGAVTRWRVTAGARSVVARVDPFTGVAEARLRGAEASTLRVRVDAVQHGEPRRQVSIREIESVGLPAERSLVLPQIRTTSPTSYLFTSRPESRACVPTLVAPDCDPNRYRPAEESTGIDRELTFAGSGTWTLYGNVVARANPSTVRLLDPFGGRTVMRGSSTYLDDPTVSPRMAYDNTPTTSWIADPRDSEPTLVVDFDKPRRISQLAVARPASPGVAPASARIVSGEDVRQVDLGGFGTFEPLVTRHLEIRFENKTRGDRPLGVGDVRLGPGEIGVPLDGAERTGAVCGFGPNVFVDGRRYLTKVEGLMGDVSSSGPLALSLCGDPILVGDGPHRIRIVSTPQFQPVRIVLAELDNAPETTTERAGAKRSLDVLHETSTTQRARIDAGEAALLVTGRNWNDGWLATLDGKELAPQRIDGWAQGWRVPEGSGGIVRVEYRPQRAYLVGLVGGLAVAGAMLLAAAVLLARTGLRPGFDPPVRVRHRRRRPVSVGVVATGTLLGGLPGLMGALLARMRGIRRDLRFGLAGVLLVAGPLVSATSFVAGGPDLVPDSADVLSGIGAVLALVLGLMDADDERG